MNRGTDLFANPRPVNALADRFANVWQFGYVTNDLDRATQLMAKLIPDRVRAGYLDTTPLLGHWLEVCRLQPGDIEFFRALFADSA